ncbi:MAG: aromatic amino acid ammonia-lyase [Sulfolobales archaeon]
MREPILIDVSRDLTCRDIYEISTSRDLYKIFLPEEKERELKTIRENFNRYINSGGSCYGITSGLGGQVVHRISDAQDPIKLIRQHAVGVGDLLPREFVRGAMIILARQLSLGYSAVSPEVISLIVEMLNKGITPLIPKYGSLGASGDLAPMSYIALAIYGEGLVEDSRGRKGFSRDLFREEGLEPLKPDTRDVLSIMNNTAMSSSIAAHTIATAEILLMSLIIASSISVEAMATPKEHFSDKLVNAKKHRGSSIISRIIREILIDSSAESSEVLQDRYSFRTIPQVLGGFYDALEFSRTLVEREINSSSDNPLFIDGRCVSGGNFYGSYITISMETLVQSVIQPLIQSDRRIFSILDPSLNRGLPPFLTTRSDVGLMISQYTTAALLNRISTLAYPSSAFSAPTSASQEDHVSNSYNSALKAYEIIDLGFYIASIEYLVSSYALTYRKWYDKTSSKVRYYVEQVKDLFDVLYEKPLDQAIKVARDRLFKIAYKEARANNII